MKDTQKPRESKGKKNMESGFTPSIIIWQLWSRDSYLDLVSLIQVKNQEYNFPVIRLYDSTFLEKKLNFISKTFHSKGEELISHLHVYQKKWQGLLYFLWKNQGTKPTFPVFVLMIPLVSSAALHKDKLPRTLRDYTEYNHLIKKKKQFYSLYPSLFPLHPLQTQQRSVC